MRKLRTLHEFLMEQFAADSEEAVSYLDVALEEYQEDGDILFFLLGLQHVIEARGGVSEVAKKIGIAPQVLSDVLSSEKAPRLDTLNTILQGLGCRLSIQPLKDTNASTDKDYSVAPRESADPHLEVTTERGDLR
ncbi:MAG: helix-turn-helix domain-containing protein [Candidatus Poribacteria bacterium]|nr:helix-turn-helix domain-containing protein [Candidatus Poribacteria bacterium]